MSDYALDDELVQDYLAESREHLATIETDLLKIEQAGAAIDEQLVNRVFRAAHSIKGGAGFFDFVKIRELGHKTENILDMVRARQLVPSPEVVNILLLAFDKLSELIDNYASSNDADISVAVTALTNVSTGNLPESKKALVNEPAGNSRPELSKFADVSALDLDQAAQNGLGVFVVAFDLLADIQRRGMTPLGVFGVMIDCGQVLGSALDIDSVGTLDEEPSNSINLEILYASSLDAASLCRLLKLSAEKIRPCVGPTAVSVPLTVNALPPAQQVLVAAPPPPPQTRESAPAGAQVAAAPRPRGPEEVETVKKPSDAAAPQADATVRLNVSLLDSLMTLAGELVLSRNQLNAALASKDEVALNASANRISSVTSELQEAVTLTRMQPVGAVFAKFPRLVRDLAKDLGKEVQLCLEGGDVELDKTILEGLSDPLTHMVRNSVDHGIETPAVRLSQRKPASGTVTLKASHQAGQVVIEITDDGKGLPPDKIAASSVAKGMVTAEQVKNMTDREKMALIFLPGVSTAETVSNVSGRGVGMDVVKTNLDKLGGKIEIDSVPGQGSAFRIKLPLTLAVIPSLLVSDGGQRFAIPQVSIGELIRIPASQISERIDRAGDAELVLLRDRMVPMVHLSRALGNPLIGYGSKALNIVLVDAGPFEYGLVVGELHDSVEIVVKPMGRHLQSLREYAGATILGDGQVAVILDVAGIAARAGLASAGGNAAAQESQDDRTRELHSLLLFHNATGEHCAVPIELVTRVEQIRPEQVEHLGGRRTMQYNGASLPLVALHDVADVGELDETQQWVVVVFERAGKPVGLLVAEPLDMTETVLTMDTVTLRQTGIAGSTLLNGKTTLMIDIFELTDAVRRKWPSSEESVLALSQPTAESATILVAEDSDFFRGQIKRLIEAVGYKVLAASDGQSAWELLDRHANEISVVTTDIEMPRLDGLGLTQRIRADGRFDRLPVIAVSSLAGEEEMARGLAMGVSEYQVKLDQNQLLESIGKAVGISKSGKK